MDPCKINSAQHQPDYHKKYDFGRSKLPGEYISPKTGTKYHVEDCRYLSQSKIAIELKDAIEQGYEPCKVCHPSTAVIDSLQKQNSYKPRPPTKSTTTQNIRVGCVCNDGTRSTATGRGACSHHGGVKDWLYN